MPKRSVGMSRERMAALGSASLGHATRSVIPAQAGIQAYDVSWLAMSRKL